MKFLVTFAGLLPFVAAAVDGPVQWRNDWFGNFPDATPPQEFSDDKVWNGKTKQWEQATPKNLAWKVETANWGHSSPIVVGDRIFLMSEPLQGYAPVLQCLSLADGTELWRVEVDHIPHLPAEEGIRTAVKKDFLALIDMNWDLNQAKCGRGWVEERRSKDPEHVLVKEHDAIVAKYQVTWEDAEEKGKKIKRLKVPPPPKGQESRWKELRDKHNCWQGGWVPSIGIQWGNYQLKDYAGWTNHHPSPLWDGERVVVLTAFNSVAAYSRDGKPLWHTVLDSPDIRRPSGVLCFVHNSPLLIAGRILIQSGDFLRALDPSTGSEQWRTPLKDMQVLCHWKTSQFVPVEVEKDWYVVAHNGDLFRVADGKQVAANLCGTPEGSKTRWVLGQTVGVKDGILFLSVYQTTKNNDHTRAVRLRPDGPDKITAEVLWQAETRMGSGYGACSVIAGDTLWGDKPLDLEGKPRTGSGFRVGGGHEGIDFCHVGGRWIFAGDGEGSKREDGSRSGKIIVRDLQSGATRTVFFPVTSEDTPSSLRRRWRAGGWVAGWGWGGMFFSGRSMLLRGAEKLLCFSEP